MYHKFFIPQTKSPTYVIKLLRGFSIIHICLSKNLQRKCYWYRTNFYRAWTDSFPSHFVSQMESSSVESDRPWLFVLAPASFLPPSPFPSGRRRFPFHPFLLVPMWLILAFRRRATLWRTIDSLKVWFVIHMRANRATVCPSVRPSVSLFAISSATGNRKESRSAGPPKGFQQGHISVGEMVGEELNHLSCMFWRKVLTYLFFF